MSQMLDFNKAIEYAIHDIDCQIEAYKHVCNAWCNLNDAYSYMFLTGEREVINKTSSKLYDIIKNVHYLKVSILQALNIIKTYKDVTDDERQTTYNKIKNKVCNIAISDYMPNETYNNLISIFKIPLNELNIYDNDYEIDSDDIETNLV